ncbi:MAG TPA: hypothetical protein VKU41_24335 [Polyangiaceae bacterium]|nr:hypothetical protein [Polyangiaceae bacterium]
MQPHDNPPLYVQVQLEPVQSASHVLPRASWHIVVVGDPPPGPTLAEAEHDIVPDVGLGMAGHTVSGTHGSGSGGDDGPASLRHAFAACSWASHPGKTVPIDVQSGCTDSVQLRKATTTDAQGAVIAAIAAQRELQEGSGVDEGHAAAANFAQKVEQEAATRDGEQPLPHGARLPASSPESIAAPRLAREPASPPEPVVAPPQARVDAIAQAKKVRSKT